MIRIETYHDYYEVPGHLRRQWCRMHLQMYPHVPKARKQWRKTTKAVLCLLLDDSDNVLSWCMYIKKRSGLQMYTYTRRSVRGLGYGKEVAQYAKVQADYTWANRPGALFFPHDEKAQALYASLGYYEPKKPKMRSA